MFNIAMLFLLILVFIIFIAILVRSVHLRNYTGMGFATVSLIVGIVSYLLAT